MRPVVIDKFPRAPGLPTDTDAYMHHIEDIYVTDAYHSLSIEGYRVSPALIERVRSENWNPDNDNADREHADAMATRGYHQAFQAVKNSISKVLHDGNPGTIADKDRGTWYREMFAPSAVAGVVRPAYIAGYRSGPVFIRRSMHVPPNRETVRDLMPAFFELLQRRNRCRRASRTGTLRIRVYPSLYGWKWTNGTLFHEFHAGRRRLSVDHHPRG